MTRRWNRLAALALILSLTLLGTAVTHAAASPTTGSPNRGGTLDVQQYLVTIINKSEVVGQNAVVFQQQSKMLPDIFTLAWQSQPSLPNLPNLFPWSTEYDLVWGTEGKLGPGVNYGAGGILPTDLQTDNKATVSFNGSELKFSETQPGPKDSIIIEQDCSVPYAWGNVGIGMSGAATTVLSTIPDFSVQFQVGEPSYWIAFGTQEAGDVVTMETLIKPQQLKFPSGFTYAQAVFDGATWAITYGPLPPADQPSPPPPGARHRLPPGAPSPPPSWSPSPSHS